MSRISGQYGVLKRFTATTPAAKVMIHGYTMTTCVDSHLNQDHICTVALQRSVVVPYL